MASSSKLASDFLIIGCTSELGSGLLVNLLEAGFRVDGIRFKTQCTVESNNHRCFSIDLLSSNLKELPGIFKTKNLILSSWFTEHGTFWNSELNAKWFQIYKELCQYFILEDIEKIIGIGSCAEYSWDSSSPITETTQTKPESLYGLEKLRLFQWLSASFEPILWVRPFHIYGPKEDYRKLISSAVLHKKANSVLEIHSPYDKFDLVYVDDVIHIITKLILKSEIGVFNIGTGVATNAIDVANIVGCSFQIVGEGSESSNPTSSRSVVADNSKVMNSLGFIDWIPVSAGISKFIPKKI